MAVITVTVTDPAPASTATRRPPEPLHLIGPWTDTNVLAPVALQTGAEISSNLSFPHGNPPLPPLSRDPLGLESLSRCYDRGPMTILFCLGLATTIQIFRLIWKPPSSKPASPPASGSYLIDQQSFHTVAADPETASEEKPNPSRRICSLMNLEFTSQHAPQLLYLTGLNAAALDLITRILALDQAYGPKNDDIATWMPLANRVAVPLSIASWGTVLLVHRMFISFMAGYRKQLPGEDALTTASRVHFKRHLLFDAVALPLPAAALTQLATNHWLWHAASNKKEDRSGLYPVDFMPVLYWDGMDDSGHALLVLFMAITGAVAVADLVLSLLAAWGTRSRKVGFALKVGMWGWLALVALAFVAFFLAAVIILLGYIASGLTGRWGAGLAAAAETAMESSLKYFLGLSAPFLILGTLILGTFFMPGVSLFYLLKGWVFGATSPARSCFFIPCGPGSDDGSLPPWTWGQILMVLFGLGLLGHQIRRLMEERRWRNARTRQG